MPDALPLRIAAFIREGLIVVFVLNNPDQEALPEDLQIALSDSVLSLVQVVVNRNQGGVAGGFNRGVERALAVGATWITLLDQDSDLSGSAIARLREPWQKGPLGRLLVGPCIWDVRRGRWHSRQSKTSMDPWTPTRLLISSGTTFRASDWINLGLMEEWLVVDFVDHAWSFRAQSRGFVLLQHHAVILQQQFGEPHPNFFCRLMGLELYPPRRHFYGLRNLRWLVRKQEVPIDLKFKEILKMLIKPWLWLLFERQRLANLKAIFCALRAPLPPTMT